MKTLINKKYQKALLEAINEISNKTSTNETKEIKIDELTTTDNCLQNSVHLQSLKLS